MEALTFIAKIFDARARVGAAIAFGAGALFALQHSKVEPFASLGPSTAATIFIAGIIGAFVVLVDLLIVLWGIALSLGSRLRSWYVEYATRNKNRQIALKNFDSMSSEFGDVLVFLKRRKTARFYAQAHHRTLCLMRESSLLEIDDPSWDGYSDMTYFRVPDYIWQRIDEIDKKDRSVPNGFPWLETYKRGDWIV